MQLKTRIFFYQTLTLLFMFILAFAAFDILGERLITGQAQEDLRQNINAIENMLNETYQNSLELTEEQQKEALGLAKQIIRSRYLLNDNSVFLFNGQSGATTSISENDDTPLFLSAALMELAELPESGQPFQLEADNRSYYLALLPLPKHIFDEQWHVALYTNMSVLTEILHRQGQLLIFTLSACALVMILISFLISSWIVRPINSLRNFANAIGHGDFARKNFNINDIDLALLAEDMNTMADRLKQNEYEQKLFYQNVSHDLRTPLMSIQGYAEGIQLGVFDSPEKPAAIILEESYRLYGMVDNLLYLSHLDVSDIRPDTVVDIREPLSRAVERLQGMSIHNNKHMTCQFSERELLVRINEESFERALQNLLSNALRYAKQEVFIFCEAAAENMVTGARIEIADDGPGFNEEELPNIFERFYKGKQGNYGLGLSIARETILSHDGTITAANAEAGGAVITVRLPLYMGDL